MVKGAESLELHEADAIPFQQPRSHSTPLLHTTSNNRDQQDNEEASPDGAISTLVYRNINRNPRTLVGEDQPYYWVFLCALLLILALLTLLAKELATQLGPDHWAIGVLNSTTEPIKNVLI